MEQEVSESWNVPRALASYHGNRRSLIGSEEWSLVGIGILVILFEILWTIFVVATILVILYFSGIWSGTFKWPWTGSTDSRNSLVDPSVSVAISTQLNNSAENFRHHSRASQDESGVYSSTSEQPSLGERCPSYGPRIQRTLTFPDLLAQSDIELEYYNFDNVDWHQHTNEPSSANRRENEIEFCS
ncbi:hypothetical protein MPTK1_8g11010 [Marchantia polymorpha subsp. ruderalis]|uniref:Uncharacterized protein n=1 Tax=Marchantia polymorpha TaxID=3197 RepID=A0A2R6XMM2_MARPO|nr:hypothetical protein MARPO_0008s0121 [Marchantia polymorpha]BBN19479.1 hypothetical protein Mp_8g11010 [Marchantia polymorpha subsp. ruderalis]|eukprot:PTQ47350.1 hypothetical protein MARPO_0008s0121 [Marchantia polymorpha]